MNTHARRPWRKWAVALGFLLPNIVGFLAFTLVPMGMSFGMAFTDWSFLRNNIFRNIPLHFVGWDNFTRLFASAQFWQYLGNTFFLMLGLPFAIAGSLAAALLLMRVDKESRGLKPAMVIAVVIMAGSLWFLLHSGVRAGGIWMIFGALAATTLLAGVATRGSLYRTLFYLPNFTAGVATYVLWKKFYNPDTGPVNAALAPVLDGVSGMVHRAPGWFAYGLPVVCGALALFLCGWQARRLWRSWGLSEAGSVAVAAGLLSLTVPLALLLYWLNLSAGTSILIALAATVAGVLLWQRQPRPWGKPKMMDKGLGTEVALALVLIPALVLLAAGIAYGPALPGAAAKGIPPPDWLGSYAWAKPALMIMTLWAAIGSNNMILYLAGLTNVPPELYEAADMDGATAAQRFWHITWPQLAPVTFFIAVMGVISGLQGGFEMAMAMTKGGPAGSTTTLSYYIYIEGFQTGQIGYASAIAVVLFILVLVLTLFNFRYGNRHVND